MRIRTSADSAHAGTDWHFVQFYDEETFLVDEVAAFFRDAAQQGHALVLIATEEHRQALAARPELAELFLPTPAHPAGQLVALDARETLARFMVRGAPDEALFLASVGALVQRLSRDGRRTVSAFGEMVALLVADGDADAAVQLELLWNRLGAGLPLALMCGYPMRLFSGAEDVDAFRHVCATHGLVRPMETPRPARRGDEAALTLAELQQKTLALQREVARREAIEQALRRREAELSDFLENALEGMHRVGNDGRILWANRAELEMLGYAADEYVGRHIAEFYVDQALIASILQRLRAGEVLYDQPATVRCKDGSIRHVLIHSNAHFEGGELAWTRCFTRDVTARYALERTESERDRLLEDLRRASGAKDEFLAMLGHELRNPLAPIVTALQLMKMRGDISSSKEQAIIQRQVDHLVRLVDDLLDVSRITRGKVELRKETVPISQVVVKAVEMASMLFEQRRHHLAIDVPARGLSWYGDPTRLAQVIANLLTNAARYTEPGGDVRLRAHRDGADIVISVQDNGRGMEPDMLAHAFDLFFQGQQGVDRSEGGLGIGLALVRNLVELHGGTVDARSDGRGKGCEFTVRLPAAVPQDGAAPARAATRADAAPAGQGCKVLIVDDNVDAADSLAAILQARGHDVKVVYDPVAALRLAEGFEPDFALLDIGLPVMDGYELAIQLRQALGADRSRFVALTGYGQQGDREKSFAAGFDHHMVKPVPVDELLRLMERAPAAPV